MPRNAWEFKGTFLVKNAKILIFWHKNFLKQFFTQIKTSVDLYDVANKLHKTVFEYCRKCAFYAILKKVKFPKISTSFPKTLLN